MVSRKSLRVLGIETSCDETAVALVEAVNGGVRVRKHLVSTQIPIHARYGGVVPEVAARSHVPETVALITQVLGRRGIETFDAIAVTHGPGLSTALGVGVEAARTLAFVSGKPVIGVNHLEGHIASAWLSAVNRRYWKFPLLALIVSGGHTELVLMSRVGGYQIIGATRDDAAGEAFDKSGKLMGLPYPGGPQIARLAKQGDPGSIPLPRPMLYDPSFDMSFSGLKTAVRQTWEANETIREQETFKANMAASIQQAIVDVLIEKTLAAARMYHVMGVLLVGGVSANECLRESLFIRLKREMPEVRFLPSDRRFITDNAAMIAAAGLWHFQNGEQDDWRTLDVHPELSLETA